MAQTGGRTRDEGWEGGQLIWKGDAGSGRREGGGGGGTSNTWKFLV